MKGNIIAGADDLLLGSFCYIILCSNFIRDLEYIISKYMLAKSVCELCQMFSNLSEADDTKSLSIELSSGRFVPSAVLYVTNSGVQVLDSMNIMAITCSATDLELEPTVLPT